MESIENPKAMIQDLLSEWDAMAPDLVLNWVALTPVGVIVSSTVTDDEENFVVHAAFGHGEPMSESVESVHTEEDDVESLSQLNNDPTALVFTKQRIEVLLTWL